MGRIPDAVGPCGVYCGACPSFGRSCHGCAPADRDQGRTSKWSCRLRTCCFEGRSFPVVKYHFFKPPTRSIRRSVVKEARRMGSFITGVEVSVEGRDDAMGSRDERTMDSFLHPLKGDVVI